VSRWLADVAHDALGAGGQGHDGAGCTCGADRIEADGADVASESYGRDDSVMRMRAGRISGLGACCTGTRRKRPSDGILPWRTFGRQRIPTINVGSTILLNTLIIDKNYTKFSRTFFRRLRRNRAL